MKYSELVGASKRFKGIGTQVTLGRRNIPFSIKLQGGDYITGTIWSHEFDSDDVYFLFSIEAQSTLYMQKDVQEGTCYLKEVNRGVQL